MGTPDVVELRALLAGARAGGERLGPEVAAAIALQVCDALVGLHAYAIVHGALRPEHVLLASTGVVTVVGLGRHEPAAIRLHDVELPPSPEDARQIRYIAPEQVSGHRHEPASDIWSAAIVASEIAAGEHPIRAEITDALAIALVVLGGIEPAAAFTPAIRAVFQRALDRDPTARPTASTMRTALVAAAATDGVDLGPSVIARAIAAMARPVTEPTPIRIQAAGSPAPGGPRCWCVHLAAGLPPDVATEPLTAYVRDDLSRPLWQFSTSAHQGEVALCHCQRCGGTVLDLLIEHEGFTGSRHHYYTPLTETDCDALVRGALDGASYEAWAGDRCGIHLADGRATIYRRARIGYLGIDHRLG